ncbi:type II secretion system protein GspD [Maribacter sp. 2210JD10-5]|uniref:type II secretion system protein GspD n=1 Tax=Maribacter sp. 2210JD10-5 TaxID=3386272 RepID=UPI0039BC3A6B
MKKILTFFFLLTVMLLRGQELNRIQRIQNQLELLSEENSELKEDLKLEINVTNVTLPNFLLAVSKVHGLNLNVSQNLNNITIVNNFANVTVADLLVYLCKEYKLDIEFTGNILSIKKYIEPVPEPVEKAINVIYNPSNESISLDLQNDPLEKVFRKIMDETGKNLLFSQGMEGRILNLYLNNIPFDTAMEKMAQSNGILYSKSKDGFHLFNSPEVSNNGLGGKRKRVLAFGNPSYKVLDTINKVINVDFKNTPIASIINDLSYDLDLDVYTATPLDLAGNITFNAEKIFFDDMLELIFESQETTSDPIEQNPTNRNQSARQNGPTTTNILSTDNFTFKKENNIYFFGTANQLSLREVEVVQMMYRSVELLSDPSQYSTNNRTAGRTNSGNVNYFGNGNSPNGLGQQGIGNRRNINTDRRSFDSYEDGAEALISILPDELKNDLDIRVDFELNSFLVSGPASKINRFRKFIKEIDKPVPVVLIEVMLIEVRKSATVETGISWGIGESPVNTGGKLFPETDVTLGANTVNKIIGGFDGFGSFNIGQVVPEFFANIKAMEENGNLKIRSTPKLSTLNGHRAHLSIGETTYYVVTNQNFFGSQIPTTSEIRNYEPIDAELAVSIKPLVSGNGQVTLDINVIQSDFSGERIEDDAPPGLTSREFSSIIRMQNQDLAVLGGLEEKVKNDSGSGVPLLARIPVIKWLFSKRKREDTKQKLTILIKPTVIY